MDLSNTQSMLMEDSWSVVRNSARDFVGYSVGHSAGDPIRYSVWYSVWRSVWDSVWDSAEDSVSDSAKHKMNTKQTYINELHLWI